ncbi:MAG: hypothetical protein ACTSRU_12820, partial [Candidatus Hodarchaeales archaeon]
TWADEEVDLVTGQTWKTSTAKEEIFDGKAFSTYPRTDQPFMKDWDEPQNIQLGYTPVLGLDYAHVLQTFASIGQVWNYDDNASSYVDDTSEANTPEGTAFSAFASTPAADDLLYVGLGNKFTQLDFFFATVGSGSPGFTWEYYNGSSWASFTPSDTTSSFVQNGVVSFSVPANWQKTSVNSSDSLYFVRVKIDGAFSTPPTVYQIIPRHVVSNNLTLRNIRWDEDGKVNFMNNDVPSGVMNLAVGYRYGYSSTPTLVDELSAIYVSIRAFVYVTGGSFDDVTSAQLGSKNVGVGEPYINMRESLQQLKDRRSEILRLLGERVDIVIG